MLNVHGYRVLSKCSPAATHFMCTVLSHMDLSLWRCFDLFPQLTSMSTLKVESLLTELESSGLIECGPTLMKRMPTYRIRYEFLLRGQELEHWEESVSDARKREEKVGATL